MPDPKETVEGLTLVDRATLSLFATLEVKQDVTQRGLATRIGVALGLANGLLKRAVKKGFVKVQQAPAKRYAYYITPKGFAEKSRLVSEYLSVSLGFFRQAREEFAAIHAEIAARGHFQVALYGNGELAEIALISAQGCGVELKGAIQPGSNVANFLNLPVIGSIEGAKGLGIETVILASTVSPQQDYDRLVEHFGAEHVFVAPLLHVTTTRNGGAE
ncbi:MAG: MarR family transcriptional regulator [Alphaproteobacteria bacterium]|nr:MarR family transcriptional regulator [Alphaproteobacteria bacterium]